jgi:hypothetical protein
MSCILNCGSRYDFFPEKFNLRRTRLKALRLGKLIVIKGIINHFRSKKN